MMISPTRLAVSIVMGIALFWLLREAAELGLFVWALGFFGP